MDQFQPFLEHTNFTMSHNYIFDVLMPSLKPNAFKIFCFIYRQTHGWVDENGNRKKEVDLNYTDIQKGTGIGSFSTLSDGIKQLKERNLIAVKGNGDYTASTYAVNWKYTTSRTTETVVTTESVADTTTETVVTPTTETVGNINKKNKEKKEKRSTRQAATQPALLESETTKPPEQKPTPPPNPVYAVYERLSLVQRHINKGQTLAVVKELQHDGFSDDDIVGCAQWIMTEPWHAEQGKPLTPDEIPKRIDFWIKQGRPTTQEPKKTTRLHMTPNGAREIA